MFLKSNKKFFIYSFLLCIVVFALSSCATIRKLDAASVLSNTKIEIKELHLDSVEIDSNLFKTVNETIKSSLLPNPQVVTMVQNLARGIIENELGKANISAKLVAISKDTDSLWIQNFTATLTLDSLIELPLSINNSYILAPGENELTVFTKFPLDNRLFKLDLVKKYHIKGVLKVALSQEGESVPFEFNIERSIKPEEIKMIKETARENLLNGLVNDWVGAFFK